jgi:hypothetical protein
MGRKKILYGVLDCETATLPFANELAKDNAEGKKRIAIAKPLIYDIGWQVIDRQGNVYVKKQFLVAEIFAVPQVFNTAYYAEKRPIYLRMLANGETVIKPWNEVVNEMLSDFSMCDFVGAFNSMFDFVKAIPFTDLYISKLYDPSYYEWERVQRNFCRQIVKEKSKRESMGRKFDTFKFRDVEIPLFDIWGMCCESLLNRDKYRRLCLDLEMISESGEFFKTSAESSFRYLSEKYDFEEAHTALADVEIESVILSKILMRKAVTQGIEFFPFRKLGKTGDFLASARGLSEKHFDVVLSQMGKRVISEDAYDEASNYAKGFYNRYHRLMDMKEERFR